MMPTLDDPEPADSPVVQVTMEPDLTLPSNSYTGNLHPVTDGGLDVLPSYILDGNADMRPGSTDRARENRNCLSRPKQLLWKLVAGPIQVVPGMIHAVHPAWTMSRWSRNASATASAAMGMVIPRLRTPSGASLAALIAAYIAWALPFFVFLRLQYMMIPERPKNKRKFYIFTVSLASLHSIVGFPSNGELNITYTPILLTGYAYLMRLLADLYYGEAEPVLGMA